MINNELRKEGEHQYPILTIASGRTYASVLYKLLKEVGYKEEAVALRMFDKNRKQLLLREGSDRNSSSDDWRDGAIKTGEIEIKRAVQDIIYAHLIKVDDLIQPKKNHFGRDYFQASCASFSPEDDLYSALAVYRPSALTRKGAAEYWFKSDPREALVALIFEREELSHPPIINQYDAQEMYGLTGTDPNTLTARIEVMLRDSRWEDSLGIVLGGSLTHHRWIKSEGESVILEYLPQSKHLQGNQLFKYSLQELLTKGALTSRKIDTEVHNKTFVALWKSRKSLSSDDLPFIPDTPILYHSYFYELLPEAQRHGVGFHTTDTVFILNLGHPEANTVFPKLSNRGFKYVYGFDTVGLNERGSPLFQI